MARAGLRAGRKSEGARGRVTQTDGQRLPFPSLSLFLLVLVFSCFFFSPRGVLQHEHQAENSACKYFFLSLSCFRVSSSNSFFFHPPFLSLLVAVVPFPVPSPPLFLYSSSTLSFLFAAPQVSDRHVFQAKLMPCCVL